MIFYDEYRYFINHIYSETFYRSKYNGRKYGISIIKNQMKLKL